jgi:hypothetical protein
MLDGGNVKSMAEMVEAKAVVADAQPELRWFNVLEALDIALTCDNEMGQGVENAQGGRLVDGAELGLGLALPGDHFPTHL